MGFTTNVGNADSQDRTIIIYRNDDQEEAAEAIKDKLGCGRVMKDNGNYNFNTDFLVIVGADYD